MAKNGGYTLKGHKEMMGHEGYVMRGKLCRDGKPVADYFDDGNGGEMRVTWVGGREGPEAQAFKAFLATLPPLPPDPKMGHDVAMSIDTAIFIGGLADEMKAAQKMRRLCKTKTVFRMPGDPEDTYRTFNRPYDEKMKALIAEKYPSATILNETIE